MAELSRMSYEPPSVERGAVNVPPDVVGPDAFRFAPFTLEQAREAARRAGEGLHTGFDRLDAHGLRWQPGKLYAVVGRPSEGKTTLLLEFLMRHVEERGLHDPTQPDLGRPRPAPRAPAVFVSYEENLHHIYLRLLLRGVTRLRLAGSAPRAILPRPLAEEWLRSGRIEGTGDAAGYRVALSQSAALIDDAMQRGHLALVDGDADGGEVDTLMRRLTGAASAAGGPPSLVVLDYYQKIRPARGLRGASRQEQLQDVADRLRRFAKGEPVDRGEADTAQAVPVVVGAQVNRDAANGEQPELHQIREADDLANDAAGVITLFRPNEQDGGELRVKIVKNRDGKRGDTVSLGFHGAGSYISDTVSASPTGNASGSEWGR